MAFVRENNLFQKVDYRALFEGNVLVIKILNLLFVAFNDPTSI